MEDYKEYFKDKKITVMGLGLLGRGVGDTAFLAECGADLIVTDLKTEEELKKSLDQLSQYKGITYTLGEHRKEDFENRDMVLVAAGIPADSEYLAHAREGGILLTQSAVLFAKISKIPIVGITGTRGKSTVTHMIHHALEVATGDHVILGGNIKDVSNLQLLKEVNEDSIAIMELDSWQLQAFGWAKISPQIAVFTNFMEDHLVYYNGDMDAYFADKANIFLNQEDGSIFITTPEIFEMAKDFAKGKNISLRQEVILTDDSSLPEDCIISMPGKHNRENAALAYETLRALSLNEEHIAEGLATFKGVPGRLEYLGEGGGIKIYNDNNATTSSATIAALNSVGVNKNIVLIVGGTDKNIDTEELADVIKEKCKFVVLYSGSGTEKLKENLSDDVQSEEYEVLEDCVKAARSKALPGDVILFSPAFSSFGKYYENEYDRNNQFLALADKILEERD